MLFLLSFLLLALLSLLSLYRLKYVLSYLSPGDTNIHYKTIKKLYVSYGDVNSCNHLQH